MKSDDQRKLRKGQERILPSGSVVRLVSRDGVNWHCVYVGTGLSRGEITLTALYLVLHGQVI